MWECTEIGVSTIPDPRSVLSGARVGLMISFGDKKSEIHPLYPAAKQIRMRDLNISLLDSQGNLNGQAKRRAENATHVIFCLSDHIKSSAKNFKGIYKGYFIYMIACISCKLSLVPDSFLGLPDQNWFYGSPSDIITAKYKCLDFRK